MASKYLFLYRRLVAIQWLGAVLLVSTFVVPSEAQVTPSSPISSSGLNTQISPPKAVAGGRTQYDIIGGERRGTNLFHSFLDFNVPLNNIANFLNEATKPATANILSRVTGGNPSNILGILRTTDFGNANLFLINPKGIVFGPTASLDIGAATAGPRGAGSFYASTADYLKMSDGNLFIANPIYENSVKSNGTINRTILSAASPTAFGFLGPTPANIQITHTPPFGGLSVPVGQTLSLVGGPIQISGSTLSALNGRIEIASVASAGEVELGARGRPPVLSDFTALGQIDISNRASLTAISSSGGGEVLIRGGRLVMRDSNIRADSSGNIKPLGVDIRITDDIVITAGTIQSSSQGGSGRAGDLFVSANSLTLGDGSAITAFVLGTGQAGLVEVNARNVTITGGSKIDSSDLSAGTAGRVTITAEESLTVSGSNQLGPSTIATRAQNGIAGQVVISTSTLRLADKGQILATTSGKGQGGNINLQVKDLLMTTGAQISSTSTSTSTTVPPGAAGTINIKAAGSFQSDSSTVTTSAKQGKGGDITMTTGQTQLTNGTLISATSEGLGDAGNINITAVDQLVMTNSNVTTQAKLADGGSITLNAGKLIHLTDSEVTSSVGNTQITTTIGGNIFIDPELVVLKNSQILANAFAGTGGNIKIVAAVLLADPLSVIDASSTLGVSGTVTIQSPIADLSGSLVPLSQNFLNVGALLASRCAARVAGGATSSFVVAGRDGVPMEPGGLLPSPVSPTGAIGVASTNPATNADSGIGTGTLLALNTWGQDRSSGCVQ